MARFPSDGRLEDDLLTRRNHLARKRAPSESRNAFSFGAILYGTSVALLRVASMTLGNGENDLVVSPSVLAEREICLQHSFLLCKTSHWPPPNLQLEALV